MTSTIGDLLARALAAAGARHVFGEPPVGLPTDAFTVSRVTEPSLASLLAGAAGRIGSGPGVAVDVDRLLLSSIPGAAPESHVVRDAADLALAVAAWDAGRVHAAVELVVEVDLAAPCPPEVEPVVLHTASAAPTLAPSLRDASLVVFAGPGVIRRGAVDDLRRFAHHAGLGVVNTWGAKGVFVWDDPAHHGTAGLQQRDLELAGITGADLIIAVGLDDDEVPRERFASRPVLDVAPAHLPVLAARWEPAGSIPPIPPLYTELSAALAPLYAADARPNPAKLAATLVGALPAGGLVAADPGDVGFWIARCLPTTEAGSVVVPARRCEGVGVALAMAAVLAERAGLAVTSWPFDDTTRALSELAPALGAAPVVVGVGEPGAGSPDEAPDREALVAAFRDAEPPALRAALDVADRRVLEDVAGPVVAW